MAFALLTVPLLAAAVEAAPASSTSGRIGWQFAYDTAGRVTSITDPARRRTKVRYVEDAQGRLRSVTRELPGGARVVSMFDERGRRTRLIDATGGARFAYDRHDRLVRVERAGAPAVAYRYDTLGRVRSVAIGGDFSVGYVYDYLGRPERIETPVGAVLYRYDTANGAVTRRLPNGMITRHAVGPDGALESITHAFADRRIAAEYRYAYRMDRLIRSVRELGPRGVHAVGYRYDTSKRLVSAAVAGRGTTAYGYDRFGNLTDLRRGAEAILAARYDWAGRLVRHNGGACRHDDAGNLVSCDGDARVFGYAETGQLASVTGSGRDIRYRYDGDGYMIGREDRAGRTAYLPDPFADIWRPLMAQAPDGRRTYFVWEGDTPLMAVSGGEARFFLHDHLGSVRLVADRGGRIVARHAYTPFGAPSGQDDGHGLAPGYAGLFRDAAAGLTLTRARAYDPARARFLQPDPEHRVPMGSQKDISIYAYCGGDPLNFVDVNGAAPRAISIISRAWRRFGGTVGNSLRNINSNIKKISRTTINDIKYFYTPERNYVVKEVLNNAMSKFNQMDKTQQLIHADRLVRQWRYDPQQYKDEFKGFVMPTSDEWQTAENQIYVRKYVATGIDHDMKPIGLPFSDRPGMPAMLNTAARASVWSPIHYFGEKIKLDPDKLLKGKWSINNNKKHLWDRQNVSTLLGQSKGALQGLIDMYSIRFSKIEGGISTTLRSGTNQARSMFDRGRNFWVRSADAAQVSSFREVRSFAFPSFAPAKVGGIRLAGAGGALSHLGALEGIALDEGSGGLVLVAKGHRAVNLPPLRLDDVVTVFRSVYRHGQAPSVSIDPISDRPSETLMQVRHGPGTAGTYVGWVLYEADRIMKSYHLGQDNKTRRHVRPLPGYRDFHRYARGTARAVWERFWIVPARLGRTRTRTAGLTLLDVPLGVSAERMEWNGARLVTARDARPTDSGSRFRDWFTQSLQRGSLDAVTSAPPAGCGVAGRVPVFAELRRIALITAIAETLRDQGAPMPTWMRTWRVQPCPVDETTPILRLIKDRVNLTGGVQLAVADANVVVRAPDAAEETLARKVTEAVATKPLMSAVSVAHGAESYRAVALPGAGSEDLGANVIDQNDVAVAVSGDLSFGLTRRFNSFFAPDGPFGRGWTLDLPRLERQRRPVAHDGSRTRFAAAYELTSPLDSWSARFAEIRAVPEVNGRLMVPTRRGEILGLADSQVPGLGTDAKVVIFRDGRRWHFDRDGYFVARSDRAMRVTYRRDSLHRIHIVKAWKASRGALRTLARGNAAPDAEVRLDYLGMRVQSVEARAASRKTAEKARYFYDKAGRLAAVIGTRRTVKYTYQRSLVASISEDGKSVAQFGYTADGRLLSQSGVDGKKVAYASAATASGTRMTARDPASGETYAAIDFDRKLRPTRQTFGDGSAVAWRETPDHLETVLTEADGETFTVTEAKDGRRSTLETPSGETHVADFDAAGRLTRMKVDGGPIINQQWRSDGLMKSIVTDNQAVLPEYGQDGKLSSVVLTTPSEARQSRLTHYVQVSYDGEGRVTAYEDSAGARVTARYAPGGGPTLIRSRRAEMKIAYDAKGRATLMETSWGETEAYTYDRRSGALARIVLARSLGNGVRESEAVSLDDGRITEIRQFDGGTTAIEYHRKGATNGFVRSVRAPNGVRLSYGYDGRKRLDQIAVGDGDRPLMRIRYAYDSRGRLTGLAYEPEAR